MRLRSSQFVLFLLIACSVQIREEHALRWVEQQAVVGGTVRAFRPREASVQAGQPRSSADRPTLRHAPLDLLPAALAARRVPSAMRGPAAEYTTVAVHTGLLRA